MTSNKQIFILGVGAQKAGTTFLNAALQAHPEVAMSVPKEMHVFDSYFLPEICFFHERRRREALARMLEIAPSELPLKERREMVATLRLCTMQYDLQEYVRYFKEIGRKKRARFVGDITPEYQLLTAEHLQSVRALLEKHFELRVIFLMRDPIDRVFSALRMIDRDQGRTENLAHQRFGKSFKAGMLSLNSQYENTIKALDEAFDKDQVHYEFYENLFQPQSFAKIGEFLGLEGLVADFEEKINASPTTGKPGKDALAAAREFYAPTYDFCMQRFGEKRVRKLWKHC